MTSPSPGHRRTVSGNAPLNSGRELQTFSPEKHSSLVRRMLEFVSIPRTLKAELENGDSVRPSKLLLKVTIENSLGAIQLLMLPEDTVGELVKAALVIYDREKRRPFLKHTDPKYYDRHYSPFTLESLKPDLKLMNLGSRNFFLFSKPPTSSC